jgi:CRP/FNR family transcriptional regulator, cyclic AMP receptor protein
MNEPQQQSIGSLLRQGAWFGGLPAPLQDRILSRAVVRSFSKGQIVQLEDSASTGLIAVLEGQVSVLRHVSDDESALIHVGGPGFWFGEVGVLLGEATIVTAVAQGALRALILSKLEFDRIIADEPRHYPAFARIALERYGILLRYLAETLRLSPDFRLRLRLADLADRQRSQTSAVGPAVELDLSQAELAGIIGLSRQKLSGRLRRLQDEGWVELGPRRIRVLNPSGLRATAAQGLTPEH